MKKYPYSLTYSAVMMALATSAYAEETYSEVEVLDEVVVTADSFSQQIGTQKITQEQIARQPTKNGGITDLLKSNPNVRFSNASDRSTNAGEIRPNEVSFHGEKYYSNNFILDGMSNNDNINPSGSIERNGVPVGPNPYDMPNGNAQSMWLNANLLKSVEAFDSNISAKYGNFTGGVIDAQLKDPNFERQHSGRIYYRTTRDAWTHFYIDDSTQDAFENYTRLDYQPKFVKQSYGIEVSEKLGEKFALLFSYDRTTSDIDHYHSIMRNSSDISSPVANNQKRTNESYLLRGVYFADNGDVWRGTFMYAPHKSYLYKNNVQNGNFTSTGGGLQFNLEWDKQFDSLKMKSYAGYKKTGDEIAHQEDHYHRYNASSNIPWYSNNNYATWGGYGKYWNQKEIYTLKQDFNVTPFDWKETSHKINFGWKAEFAKAKYKRDSDSYLYYYRNASNVICGTDSQCIDGDQYAYQRNLYQARDVSASDNDYAAYIEDIIKWKNLELTLGSRLSHNAFLGNTNLDYRLSGSYDLFGDQSTVLFGGANRYYGGSLLAFKLRQGIGTLLRQDRSLNADGTLSEWGEATSATGAPTRYYNAKVKTPYSDEKVLGLQQNVLNTKWTLKWVHRNSRDQFSSSYRVIDDLSYRVLGNQGWSKNDTFTLAIAPLKGYQSEYANISWDAGVRISRTKTNNNYYDQSADLEEKVIYNGTLMDYDDLPPQDFNSPWSAFININTHFPKWNLDWDQRFSYTHGRKSRVTDDSVSCNGSYSGNEACGDYVGEARVLRDVVMGNEFNVDWRFTYKQPIASTQSFEITLDVNNVLNRKSLAKSGGRSASNATYYKQGRNFWLGAAYNW